MKRFIILLLSCIAYYSAVLAQDSVTMYMELPYGPGKTVTFLKDPLETEPTSLPDSFFNTPMEPNYVSSDDEYQYILILKLPKERNYFVFKIESKYSNKALIGCFSTSKNSAFTLKSLDYIPQDSVENTMETYRQARALEKEGKNRKANKLYEQAALGGNVLAMYQLAENYRNGVGCIRNSEKARYWYEQAAYFGEEYAEYLIRSGEYKQKECISVMGGR